MKRRDLLILAAGSATPLSAVAQKVARVGVLAGGNPEPFSGAIRDGLRSEGYEVGRNLQLEFRSDKGNSSALPGLAAELVRLKVDVIVASPTPAVEAAKRATTTIPIVMLAGDPVGSGLVASLARPGGNITGVSGATAEVAGKCVEILKEALPTAKNLAVLANASDAFTQPFLQHIALAALTLGVQIRNVMIGRAEGIVDAFAQFQSVRPDFLIVQPSLPRPPIVEHALRLRLPTIGPSTALTAAGGLIAYAANLSEAYRAAASYVAKILRGAKPGELPVQLPSRFDLVINMRTAQDIGFEIPRGLLLRAEVLL